LKRRQNLGLATKQPRQRHVQNSSVAVVSHRQRHLKVVTGMLAIRKLKVPLAQCAGFAEQIGDLLRRRYQLNLWNQHQPSILFVVGA
jgi:hypothetical protein